MTWPTKDDFVDGDVLTAAQVNNIADNLNLFDPTSATNGQVWQADGAGSGAYGTIATGGMTLLSTTSLTSQSSVTISNINQGYQHLYVTILDVYASTSPAYIRIAPNSDANVRAGGFYFSTTTLTNFAGQGAEYLTTNAVQIRQISNSSTAGLRTNWVFYLYNYSDAYSHKLYQLQKSGYDPTNGYQTGFVQGSLTNIGTADITSLFVQTSAGTFSGGEVKIWGVK